MNDSIPSEITLIGIAIVLVVLTVLGIFLFVIYYAFKGIKKIAILIDDELDGFLSGALEFSITAICYAICTVFILLVILGASILVWTKIVIPVFVWAQNSSFVAFIGFVGGILGIVSFLAAIGSKGSNT